MSEIYKCPKCGNNSLDLKEESDQITGECKQCGYKYFKQKRRKIDILSMIKEYAFIIAIVALIIIAFAFNSLSSQDTILSKKITGLEDSINDDIEEIEVKIANLNSKDTSLDILISDLQTRLDNIGGDINDLSSLYNNTKDILESMNNSISNITTIIENELYISDNTIVGITLTNHQNQTSNITYHSNLVLNISNTRNLTELNFFVYYPNSNITINNSSMWCLEENFNDTLKISTFGSFKSFYSDINISWNATNTSKILVNSNLKMILKINGIYFDTTDFEIRTI